MTKQNLNNILACMRGNNLFLKILLIFFSNFLVTTVAFSADPLTGVLDVSSGCTFNAQCNIGGSGGTVCLSPDKFQNLTHSESGNVCVPRAKVTGCVNSGLKMSYPNCNSDQSCVVIAPRNHSPGDGKFGVTCLDDSQLDFVKTGADGISTCGPNTPCNINQQCVDVIAVPDTTFDKTVHAYRCVDIDKLPTDVLTGDGSCATNKPCLPNERCVFNPFGEGLIAVCIPKDKLSENSTCTELPAPNGKKTIKIDTKCQGASADVVALCVFAIKGYDVGQKFTAHYQCLSDLKYFPGSANAPSLSTCLTDTDCKIKAPDSPFCLYSPATKKKQCFSQKNIYTDMAALDNLLKDPAQAVKLLSKGGGDAIVTCTAAAGGGKCNCPDENVKGCAPEPNKANSVCVNHYSNVNDDTDADAVPVCINSTNLGSGGATGNPNPVISPVLTAERTERPAPKLEIDIPGLEFTDTIDGQNTSEGEVFALPFLAQYINAVYHYAIGFGIVLAVVMLMYAGLRWMTSLGNTGSVSDAKSMVSNAVLGLVLLLSAYTILYIINPDLVQLKSIQILAPKQEVFNVTLVSEMVTNAGESAANPNVVQGTGEVVDTPGSHKSSAGANRQLTDADIKSAANTNGVDECFLWAFAKKESGGNLLSIGDDENYPKNDKPVNARRDFLMSGKKYSGATFAPPTTGTFDHTTMNSTKMYNNDKFQPDKPPNYGIDWRFSHGIGYLQLTIFPTKNNSLGKLIQGPNGSEWARNIRGKWFTVSDLLNADTALEASFRFIGPKCGKKATALEAMKCASVSNAAMGRALSAYKRCPLNKTMSITDADIAQYPTKK